jgi:hypothetical protein
MNDELKTKEYLKKLGHIRLADSSRVRIREELLVHARFHNAPVVATPKSVPSSFLNFLMRPASAVFVMMLFVGTTAFYLNEDKATELAMVDDTNKATEGTATDTNRVNTPPTSSAPEGDTKAPTVATNAPTNNQSEGVVTMNTRAKSAPVPESASDDMASDEMFMTTELSTETWSIAEHQADIEKRIEGLRALIKKYDTEIKADTKTEFSTKLNTADTLKNESKGKEEADARANLDKASVLIGEVESALSLLGEVVVEDGYITDVKLK